MLQNVQKEPEVDIIFNGVVRLLNTMHEAATTYLPNSRRAVGFYQEALVLLWHLVTLNPKFLHLSVHRLDGNQLLLPVLFLLHKAQRSPAQLVGLLHVASFVLLVLSSERSFAVRLNDPYTAKLPLDIPIFQGSHADLLVLSLYKVISDSLSRPANDALVEMLLTVVCNISPYVKSFCSESCLKLLGLVDRTSRLGYLFRSAFTHHSLVFLLEMLNNIIQYQFEGNAMMVYSILRHKETFTRIQNLELPAKFKAHGGGDEAKEREACEGQEASVAAATPAAETPAKDPQQKESAEVQRFSIASEEELAEAEVAEAEGVGVETDWVPTEETVASWKKKMPMQALNCLIENLHPQVEQFCNQVEATGQDEVVKFLQRTTLVGVLPVPHPIVIRTYQASSYTAMWFTSYLWGVIFTRSQCMPLYDWQKIRLVVINQ
jgi:hypothetical protein